MNPAATTPTRAGDHPAAGARLTESTRVDLVAPAAIQPGQPAALTYRLTDARTGAPLTDVVVSHERPMHLIVVSRDLQPFQHVHPEPTGTAGEYRVEMTFPEPGTYLLFDEFTRASGATVVQRDELVVGAAEPAPPSLAEDRAPKTLGDDAGSSLGGADDDPRRPGGDARRSASTTPRPASRSATSSRTWARRPTA